VSDQREKAREQSKFLLLSARRSAGNPPQIQVAATLSVSQQRYQQCEDPSSAVTPSLYFLELLPRPMALFLLRQYAALHGAVITDFPIAPKTDGSIKDEITDATEIEGEIIHLSKTDRAAALKKVDALEQVVHRLRAELSQGMRS
jgi:hypothetical protein